MRGSVSRCGFGQTLSGPNPFSSAADAVTILKLDPGRKSSWCDRARSGFSGSSFSCLHARRISASLPVESEVGSNPGVE